MEAEFPKFENNIIMPEAVNKDKGEVLLSNNVETDQEEDLDNQSESGVRAERRQPAFEKKIQEKKTEFLDKLFGEVRARRVAHQGKGAKITEEEFNKLPDDPNGVLYVYDAADDCYIKLSTHSLKKLGLDFGVGKKRGVTFASRPRLNLLELFKEELKAEIFKLEDFDQKLRTKTSEILRSDRRIGRDNDQISFYRANYYLKGNRYPGTEIAIEREKDRAVMLSPFLVAFVGQRHGDDYIKATLDLLSEEDLQERLRVNKYKDPMTYVNATEVSQRIHPWNVTDNNPQLQGESSKDYAERMRSLSDIGFIRELSLTLANKTGLGIHNLNFKEQQWLATYAYRHEGQLDDIADFAKSNGLKGLKSFLSLEQGGEAIGDKIIEIGFSFEELIIFSIVASSI